MRCSAYRDDIIMPWVGEEEPFSIILSGLCCQRKAVDARKAKCLSAAKWDYPLASTKPYFLCPYGQVFKCEIFNYLLCFEKTILFFSVLVWAFYTSTVWGGVYFLVRRRITWILLHSAVKPEVWCGLNFFGISSWRKGLWGHQGGGSWWEVRGRAVVYCT